MSKTGKMVKKMLSAESGFSLMEIVVVIIIIGILSLMAMGWHAPARPAAASRAGAWGLPSARRKSLMLPRCAWEHATL